MSDLLKVHLYSTAENEFAQKEKLPVALEELLVAGGSSCRSESRV